MSESIQVLFNRFLNKECTPQELEALFAYFSTTDEDTLRHLIRQEIEVAEYDSEQSPECEEKLHKLYLKISKNIGHSPRRSKVVFLWRTAVAAAVIVFFIAAYYVWNIRQPDMITEYAAYGKVLKVVLPDSSTVWLNAGTTLQYTSDFNKNDRRVILSNGGAYFDVKPDKSKRFLVSAGKVLVTVLGTAFEISDYDKEGEAQVSVTRGKVSVALTDRKEPPLLLTPGERAVIVKEVSTIAEANMIAIRKTEVNTEDVAAWREQQLIIEDQPLAEVMQRLERKYNVHIDIQNPQLHNERITVRLNDEPLTDVLTALGFSNHFKYNFENDSLVIIR